MRVLVTGAGGYIGSILVPMLLDEGHEVRAIDKFWFGRDKLPVHSDLAVITEDIRRLTTWHFGECDAVIDLAAISNDPAGEAFVRETWEINHTARVMNAHMAKAAGVKRYILPSSCAVYGFNPEPVHEGSPVNPLTAYAKANYEAERGVLPLADQSFDVIVLRQATVYGLSPRMRFDLSANVMTYDAMKIGEITIGGEGSQMRPFVHVRDTARAQMHMLTAENVSGRVFNVGGENVSIRDLAQRIGAQTRCPRIKSQGVTDHRSYQVDFSKIHSTGWKPVRRIEDGAVEISQAIRFDSLTKSANTITLDWYKRMGAFAGEKVQAA